MDLEGGTEVVPGAPPVRVIRSHRFGGRYDWRTGERLGDPERYHVVFCSVAQEKIALHEDPLPDRLLLYGAMGSGKTMVLALWVLLRVFEFGDLALRRRIVIGATAPTHERRETIVGALADLAPPGSFEFQSKRGCFVFCNRVTVELKSTKEHSTATGSAVQGQTWVACASDELQDQTHANAHIEARGRGAPGGKYRRICTATAKDSVHWRAFRDDLKSTGNWAVEHMEGTSNPFVWPRYWETLKEELSQRDYERMVLARDVGPEHMVHHTWDRRVNLRRIPEGMRDVTPDVVSIREHTRWLLLGHDPGILRDATVILRAYSRKGWPRGAHHWYIVGEYVTDQTTTEQHAHGLRRYLELEFGMDFDHAKIPVMRCDPWGSGERKPHETVYTEFRKLGFDIRTAQYTKTGKSSGQFPVRASIEMMNRLFCNARGEHRLFIAADAAGKPLAPHTMRSVELLEWDAGIEKLKVIKGDKRKDASDLPSAVRYALWPYERPRLNPGLIAAAG